MMAGDKQDNPFLVKLIALYLQAETDIINELVRLRSQGLVDYHAEAALQRVQRILDKMQSESFVYIPQMVEWEFYVHHPEARHVPEAVAKHQAGYYNALSIGQAAIADQLAANAQAEVWQASHTVRQALESALIGRREPDAFAQIGRRMVAYNQVRGLNSFQSVGDFVAALQQQGITAFVDKAGRRWSLHAYCSMAMRTTRRQAEVLAVLTADPEQDLYKISSHSTTCPLCAPYEGRVYSRSGTDPDFPPLAAAFGKVDPAGPDDLSNSWLNIHPNCLHVLLPWTDAGMTEQEIAELKRKSSFATNPPDVDPRTENQRRLYREQQRARQRELDTYKQWERYRLALGDKVPKRWETFVRHKKANDQVYKKWLQEYKKRVYLQQQLDYNINGEQLFIPAGARFETVRTIAGQGSKTLIRVEEDLIKAYGGSPGEWKKRVGKIESAKYIFDVHWYELNGVQYRVKMKYRKEK